MLGLIRILSVEQTYVIIDLTQVTPSRAAVFRKQHPRVTRLQLLGEKRLQLSLGHIREADGGALYVRLSELHDTCCATSFIRTRLRVNENTNYPSSELQSACFSTVFAINLHRMSKQL